MSNPWDPIDVMHCGHERVVAVYLVETDGGLALVDTGPASTLPALEEGLDARGIAFADLSHILLTHIHLDHAGAVGFIVRRHPSIQVHVSEIGAPHVIDPTNLERSARKVFGDEFDTLWGELSPVPAENVRVVGGRVLGLDCFPSPGHAKHNVCYLDAAGTMYCGDAAGIRIQPGRHIRPVSPPPDIDLEAWQRTIDEIARRVPARLALGHFGVKDDVADHLSRLRGRIDLWCERVGNGISLEEFVALELAELNAAGSGAEAQLYEWASPIDPCYHGLTRYWAKRREREAAAAVRP